MSLNWTAIIVGGLLYIIYGSVYYSILLSGKKSQEADGVKTGGTTKYIAAVTIAFISSFFIGVLTQYVNADSFLSGTGIGMIVGALISLVYWKNYLFGLMPKSSFLMAIGDHFIIFTILGALHGIL